MHNIFKNWIFFYLDFSHPFSIFKISAQYKNSCQVLRWKLRKLIYNVEKCVNFITMRRDVAKHLPLLLSLSLSYRGSPWSSPGRKRGESCTKLYAVCFDLVAFGTCPYQPMRIQLHTQYHKRASKITKYHLHLSSILSPSFSFSILPSFSHIYLSSIHSRSRNLHARVYHWRRNGDVNYATRWWCRTSQSYDWTVDFMLLNINSFEITLLKNKFLSILL